MAYKPPQRSTFTTNYTPKYMAGDIRTKKIPAPDQPSGLTISAYKIGEYINTCVLANNINGYKKVFEQIKILVKTVMKVLCETKLTIDFQLWNSINKIRIPRGIIDTTITFPVQKYDYTKWVNIFRSLLPSVPFPFNAATSEESDESCEDGAPLVEICINYEEEEERPEREASYEEWYETAVYTYQNLLLTSSAKKREMIDADFQEMNSRARCKMDRNKAHEERVKSIKELKKATYDWVNRIGHIVKDYGYIHLQSCPEKYTNIDEYVRHAELMMLNGVLNNTFEYTCLVDKKYSCLLNPRLKFSREEYAEAISFYSQKECISSEPAKERMIYDTIVSLLVLYYKHHYEQQIQGLLHEFDVMQVVEDYLNGNAAPTTKKIRTLINRITSVTFDANLTELKMYDRNSIISMLRENVHGEPQQECIIRLMKHFDMGDIVIAELKKHRAKNYESYHNTVAWSILYGIIPVSTMHDEAIFTPKSSIDIFVSLMNNGKINPKLIKDNYKEIHGKIDSLLGSLTGYAKYRAMDAISTAESLVK